MINFGALNTALLASFAEPVLINKTSGMLTVQAIFDRIMQTNSIGGVSFNDATFSLTVKETDIADNKIEQFNSITVRGNKFQVLEINNEEIGGLAIIKIRRFK
jgi:hypothetical protein